MKLVIDTNVLVDHIRLTDPDCSVALHAAKRLEQKLVMCEKLMKEYRGVICRGQQQMYAIVDMMLMTTFSIDMLERHSNPKVRIEFGPEEDRFHMQLAIDARADYHVTKDRGVLAFTKDMARFGVKERHPRQYISDVNDSV